MSELETEYESVTLGAIARKAAQLPNQPPKTTPFVQFFCCIDERECSFRRHLEGSTNLLSPGEGIETFGVPGFFDFPIRHKSAKGDLECTLAPEGNHPPHKVMECWRDNTQSTQWNKKRRLLAQLETQWETWSFCPIRSVILSLVGCIPALINMVLMCCFPTLKRKIVEQIYGEQPETEFENPFTVEESADKLARTLKNIGLYTPDKYGHCIVVLGHGSRTVNNPFDAAHNCGACGGREGGPNARLIASVGNDRQVRASLAERHGISIPDHTHFVGGYHDTSSELVDLYDLDRLPQHLVSSFSKIRRIIDEARGRNALERCGKFMLFKNDKKGDNVNGYMKVDGDDKASALEHVCT